MKKLIIFDFDGTLTKRDTLRPFVKYIAVSQKCNYKLILFYCLLIQLKLKLITDKPFKETVLRLFIKGMNVTEVQKIVVSFFDDQLQYLLNDVIFDKLKNHIASGDRVYLASANFDFFLYPLIKKWKLNGIISTETEKQDNCFTGKIVGITCKGENKVIRIKAVLGEEALKTAVAYGDDEDSALLSSVGHGIKVSNTNYTP